MSITNVIMDELLGDERTPRAFRAKFPEEVLQESLAGQLWFGAECLAAGSFIMNREWESGTMRPLARAVTKSLDIVRNLLREQCLRIKTPNSPRLNLDTNDASTETLCESLKIFDRLFAEFELLYVSAMVQVKSKQEHETQELICVLFSETLQRALRIGHLSQDQVDYFDPALMFSIPRLAIVAGLVVYNSGPLNLSHPDHLSEMFRPFRTLLIKIRDLLETLSPADLRQLELLLCTNEEVVSTSQTTATTKVPQAASGSGIEYAICDATSKEDANVINEDRVSSREAPYEIISTPTSTTNDMDGFEVSLTPVDLGTWANELLDNTNGLSDGFDEFLDAVSRIEFVDNKSMVESMDSSTELPSGFLISNTNLGNLLQPIEAPLTDRFIATDDEMHASTESTNHERTATSQQLLTAVVDSGLGTEENTSQDRTPDSEEQRVVSVADTKTPRGGSRRSSAHWERRLSTQQSPGDQPSTSHTSQSPPHTQSQHRSNRYSRCSRSSDKNQSSSSTSHRQSKSPSSTSSSSSSTSTSSAGSTAQRTPSAQNAHSRKKLHRTSKRSSTAATLHDTTTSGDDSSTSTSSSSTTSSNSSAADDPLHLANARLKSLTDSHQRITENLLHRLFVCIAGVADQLQTNFASDLRQILRSVFLMNMSPATPEEIEVPTQPKDADGVGDLFEFRASEQDVVIHREQREGSNQSIYSAAEEANPEDTDSVFGTGVDESVANRRQERSASFESGQQNVAPVNVAFRSRSLGEEESTDSDEAIFTTDNDRRISSIIRQRTALVTVPHSRPAGGSAASSPVGSHGSGSSSPTQMSTSPDSAAAANYRRRNCERTTSVQPPRWIPDDEAPRCMACGQGFTTFRRRHHCRNCGGVFCGVCSSTSAPLPKYGWIKAVRVCKECFLSEVGA